MIYYPEYYGTMVVVCCRVYIYMPTIRSCVFEERRSYVLDAIFFPAILLKMKNFAW